MIIRQENKNDYLEIFNLVKTAFKTAEHSDRNEQNLVTKLRNDKSVYIPELSLVAVEDEKIVGFIMFTKIYVGKRICLALAPLAVLPEKQKQGIGKKLIEEGHKKAKKMDYSYSFVLGSEKYYPKSGYKSSQEFGIKSPFDVPPQNFMMIELNISNKLPNGKFVYSKAFD